MKRVDTKTELAVFNRFNRKPFIKDHWVNFLFRILANPCDLEHSSSQCTLPPLIDLVKST